MSLQRQLNTMETINTHKLSIKLHTTNIKKFMHQYITQLHVISMKQEMAAPLEFRLQKCS